MIQVGRHNLLRVVKDTPQGYYLTDEEGEQEILLPVKYIPEGVLVGDEINVFVYLDSEARIICTTLKPTIEVLKFAYLEVLNTTEYGAFLDFGIAKDLFVPISEQAQKMHIGEKYIVFMFIDQETQRLSASSKINQFVEQEFITVSDGEEVELLITQKTDLGYNVIINDIHKGLIYNNEVFKNLDVGYRCKGYIKTVREDGKIDVTLQKQGYSNVEPNAQKILNVLKVNNGFLPLTDKSNPDEIYSKLEMSKKTFKKAIGSLYKQKLVKLEPNGIKLV